MGIVWSHNAFAEIFFFSMEEIMVFNFDATLFSAHRLPGGRRLGHAHRRPPIHVLRPRQQLRPASGNQFNRKSIGLVFLSFLAAACSFCVYEPTKAQNVVWAEIIYWNIPQAVYQPQVAYVQQPQAVAEPKTETVVKPTMYAAQPVAQPVAEPFFFGGMYGMNGGYRGMGWLGSNNMGGKVLQYHYFSSLQFLRHPGKSFCHCGWRLE